MARRSRRDDAAKALWAFERGLRDYGYQGYAHYTHDGNAYTKVTKDDLAELRAHAYYFKNYLPGEEAEYLAQPLLPDDFRNANPLEHYEETLERANRLSKRLTAIFGSESK